MMNKVIRIGLNPYDIQKAIEKLNKLQNEIPNLSSKIVEAVANEGLDFLNEEYENTPSNISFDTDDIKRYTERSSTGYNIIAEGKDVLYAEYGTGEQGARNPHPEKSGHGLNDYNSGPIVSTHINKSGRHYWFYKGEYTEGIPSGKQMFNTRNYVKDKVIPQVSKKMVGDLLSKL